MKSRIRYLVGALAIFSLLPNSIFGQNDRELAALRIADSIVVNYLVNLLDGEFSQLLIERDTVIFVSEDTYGIPSIMRIAPDEQVRKRKGQFLVSTYSWDRNRIDGIMQIEVVIEMQKRLTKQLWQLQGYYAFELSIDRSELTIKLISGIGTNLLFQGSI